MPMSTAELTMDDLPPAVRRLVRAEARRCEVRVGLVLGPAHYEELTECRYSIWWRMFEELQWSRAAIARLWRRDWKTINRGIQLAEEWMQ